MSSTRTAVRHRLLLEEPPRVRLGEAVVVHEPAFGAVDELAGVEALLELVDVSVEQCHLREAAERDLDRRDQVTLLERLDEVCESSGVAGLLDQLPLRERGEDQHRGHPLAGHVTGGREAVEPGHLDVEDHEVGLLLADELDRLVTAPGLAHDVVTLLDEQLLEIEPDDRFVLRDDDADRGAL